MGDNPKKIVPRMKNYEDDGPWMWVAFVPDFRLILDFVIGPRKQYVADKLVELVNNLNSAFLSTQASIDIELWTKP